MNPTLLKKPAFWIVVLIASALCVFTVLRYFGDAFSVLDLDVRMSRTMAIDEAKRINETKKLTSATLTEAVASFGGDSGSQTFIELEGGGKPALKPLLGDDEFTLYKWRVRLFAPSVEREVLIAFTPDGRPSGFFSKLPEAEPGAALTSEDARTIAIDTATKDWNVDFARYRPLTASAVTRPGKRVDHEFVYERKLEGAPAIGDGRLRLRMVVTGDRLTQLQRYIYVPEAFSRRYETVRSVNNIIALAASMVAGVVYGLGGCLIGLIWLMRRHAVRWAPSAKWAAVVALLIIGSGLASVSGSWFSYDTATSASTHVIARIGFALIGGVVTWLLLTVVFATAEGLGREAFGAHPQLWRAWRRPAANSREIWGRTLAGYAWIGFDLAFIAIFYFLVQRYLGWWSPSDALIDPNILGTPQPWIGPVSMALQAGMMEESLFRAIPLAGAALLGRYFKREKLIIIVALVLQAIVFGCAHANYPGQPAYARPIELFLPSLVWGIVYLRFGLIPGMLFHFGFDLVLMSIPLFVTDAPGVMFDRAMVIGIAALPLIVLTVQRLRAGRLIDLPASERNAAGVRVAAGTQAAEEAVLEVVDEVKGTVDAVLHSSSTSSSSSSSTRRDAALLIVIAIVGIVGLGTRIAQPFDAPGLTIDRSEALAIAERALAARGVQLDARWHRSVKAFGVGDPTGTTFVWREGGREVFAKLLGKTIAPPHWEVRFARFDGNVTERESWRVSLVDDRPAPDGIRLIEHDIPEANAGKRLTEAEARPLAEAAITDWLKLPAGGLRAVSAQASERPSRVDWLFVYADPAVTLPAGGEARVDVEIDGDEVVTVGRSLFVPDAWSREQRRLGEKLTIPRYVLGVLGLAIAIAGLVSLVRRLVGGEASSRAAWVTALLIAVTLLGGALLDLNASQFTFTIAEPFDNQMLGGALRLLGLTAAGALFGALIAAVGVRIGSRADADAETRSPLQRWAAPLAIALLVAGVGGLASWFGPARDPRVLSVGAADSIAPWLNAFLGDLDFSAGASFALLGVALLSSRKRAMQIAIAVGFIVVALLGRASSPDPTIGAIAGAGVAGAVAWLIYRTQIRDRPWVVAPSMLCLALIGQIAALFNGPFPGSRVATITAIIATLIGYRIWRWLVGRDQRVFAAS